MNYDDPSESWSDARLVAELEKRAFDPDTGATPEGLPEAATKRAKACEAALSRGRAEQIQTLRDVMEQESR